MKPARRILCWLHLPIVAGTWAMSGCCCCCPPAHRACDERSPCSIAEPPGVSLAQWKERQAAKAAADNLVVYQLDWVDQSPQLKPAASRRLQTIARGLVESPDPMVIEPSGDESLDRARRVELVRLLSECGVAEGEQRVIVDVPLALGLRAAEAEETQHRAFGSSPPLPVSGAAPVMAVPPAMF